MPAILDEHQQWMLTSGKPNVGGNAYFGDQGADPKTSPQDIFSDRDFSTQIANPQSLDSDGRTANKVWIKGRYSIQVDDINGVQQYLELDAGESESVGTVTLDNVQGATDISATGTPTVTSYVDKETYIFKTVSINGTPVTLDIDEVGQKPVTYSDGSPILGSQWLAAQIVAVDYNETSDSFIWEQFYPMSQAEAEAGTDTVARVVAPEQLFQAITALSGLPPLGAPFERLQVNAGGTALEYTVPPIFLESFTSADQVLTAGGALTLPHGLSTAPTLVQVRYKCIDAAGDAGYVQNDEIIWGPMDTGTANNGVSVVPDATNLQIRFGSSTLVILNKTTGVAVTTIPTRWNVIFRAWA